MNTILSKNKLCTTATIIGLLAKRIVCSNSPTNDFKVKFLFTYTGESVKLFYVTAAVILIGSRLVTILVLGTFPMIKVNDIFLFF